MLEEPIMNDHTLPPRPRKPLKTEGPTDPRTIDGGSPLE